MLLEDETCTTVRTEGTMSSEEIEMSGLVWALIYMLKMKGYFTF
jgi:hypothetical protein